MHSVNIGVTTALVSANSKRLANSEHHYTDLNGFSMSLEVYDADILKEIWIEEQLHLRNQLVLEDPLWLADRLNSEQLLIGGFDVSFSKVHDNLAVATLAVVDIRTLDLVYEVSEQVHLTVPYIPTFLGYREVQPFQRLYETLKRNSPSQMPHVLMVDGNGTIHPRGFGSACLLGYTLQCPTIGVAKNLLETADHAVEDTKVVKNCESMSTADVAAVPSSASKKRHDDRTQLAHAGDRFPILNDEGQVCGMALLNTSKSKNPVYISPGHYISLETACNIVLKVSKFRSPEPIRMADQISRRKVKALDDQHAQS